MEDQSLILSRLKAGDLAAFDEVIRLYQPAITKLTSRLLGWRNDVEDVVQDVFFTAYRSIGKFRGDSSLNTWLSRIAINRCREEQRKQTGWRRFIAKFQTHTPTIQTPSNLPADEVAESLRTAMQQIAAPDREVLVLYYLEDLASKEIALLLGISDGAVDVRLHRARQKLKSLLGHLEESFHA